MKLFKKKVIEAPLKAQEKLDESDEKAALNAVNDKIQAETDLKNIAALMTQEKQDIDLKYKDGYDDAQKRLLKADAFLEQYALKTKDNWSKKSLLLGQCKLAFRVTKKLVFLDGFDWDKVGAKGLKVAPDYFKEVKAVEFRKDELKDLDAKVLTKIGLKLEVDDTFSATIV